MKLLDFMVSMPISEALGWTVLHSLWEGAVIALALATALACTRSSRSRYGAACAALLALFCAFVFTLVRLLPESYQGAQAQIHATLPIWRDPPRLGLNKDVALDLAALIPWLAPLWLGGVCLFYCRYAAGWLSSQSLRSRGVCNAPTAWQGSLTRLVGEFKISRPVLLLESFFADAPLVIGHFRPAILVPLGFLAGLPPDQVEAILLHELAHVSRSDYLVNICQRLLEGLLFYHPAAWWISHVLRAERENCCDDIVIARLGNPHAYAAALTELEKNRFEQWTPHRTAVAANGGNLVKRIRRLLYPRGPSGLWAPAMAAAVLLVSGGVLFAAWRMDPAPRQTAVSEQVGNKIPEPWQKWLNEDVVYIISDEEKAAFERLTSDEERQHFADQFWERRNPTPGTPENAFKVEHYRRIAFANKHYRTASGAPGWQTDRGHIYIVYGPPDEIDSHPKTPYTAYGVEEWKYQKVEGIGGAQMFSFFDRTGGGDFRLGPAKY